MVEGKAFRRESPEESLASMATEDVSTVLSSLGDSVFGSDGGSSVVFSGDFGDPRDLIRGSSDLFRFLSTELIHRLRNIECKSKGLTTEESGKFSGRTVGRE